MLVASFYERGRLPHMCDLYTIDYDNETKKFQALFCHGTSSASLPSILQEGLQQPDYAAVVGELVGDNPILMELITANIEMVTNGPLSVNARAAENDVIFATWLANQIGIETISSEVDRVIRHGGEVYAQTWNLIARLAQRDGIDMPDRRFPDATLAVVMFKVPFDLLMQVAPHPRAKYEFIEEMSWNLFNRNTANYKIIREVKFLDELPADRIIWHGSPAEAAASLSRNLISPAALQALDEADPFMDLNPNLIRPRAYS